MSHSGWDGIGWDVCGRDVFWYWGNILLDIDFKCNLSCVLDFGRGDTSRDKCCFWDVVRLDFDPKRDWT